MDKRSTSELINILKTADKGDVREVVVEELCDFPTYMNEIITEKKLKRQDIFQRADIPQKYGYKLLNGDTHTTNRDRLLRIFIAMGMSLKEVQRALTIYGMPILYPKNQRDAIIIIAINKEITSVDTVDEWLEEYREEPLFRLDE